MSTLKIWREHMVNLYQFALSDVVNNKDVSRDMLVYLLETEHEDDKKALFDAANSIRSQYMGDEVHLRGIIEFSNYCRRNCIYCGIRKDNENLERYRLSPEEIVSIAQRGAKLGYKTVVLQSGEDSWYTVDILCEIIEEIKKKSDIAITLCCGEFTFSQYLKLRNAGADRYLLKHETANPNLYQKLHPDMSFENRIQCLRRLKEMGYQVGTGIMVGLPNQTITDLADDILLMKELDADMIGIGPFIPHGETPFANSTQGNLDQVLKMIAITRLVLPYAHIPATTAIGTIDSQGRQRALQVGANVVMPNITPPNYRDKYQVYPNKICLNEEPEHCRACISKIISSLGRRVAEGYGHCPKKVVNKTEE